MSTVGVKGLTLPMRYTKRSATDSRIMIAVINNRK